MSFTDRQHRIIETAKEHGGKYLLMRRFGRPEIPPSELDLDYAACDALVYSGHAIRLPWSTYEGGLGPGIELTGKPFDIA